MFIIKHIPNALTSCNLFCGCVAIVLVLNGNLEAGAWLTLLAAVFDFADGMAARLLKSHSDIGKELDSLADCITFGVLPGTILYSLLLKSTNVEWLPFAGFIISIFSALRLAKFNVDTRQTSSFLGLPTPANALFINFLPLFLLKMPDSFVAQWLGQVPVLLAITVVFSGLLVSEIPLFSLKFKSLAWQANRVAYVFLLGAVLLVVVGGYLAVPAVIVWYIVWSIVSGLIRW